MKRERKYNWQLFLLVVLLAVLLQLRQARPLRSQSQSLMLRSSLCVICFEEI